MEQRYIQHTQLTTRHSQQLGRVGALHADDLVVANAIIEWVTALAEVVQHVVLVESGHVRAVEP